MSWRFRERIGVGLGVLLPAAEIDGEGLVIKTIREDHLCEFRTNLARALARELRWHEEKARLMRTLEEVEAENRRLRREEDGKWQASD